MITDSSAVLPPAWADEAGLHVVPLELGWPDGTTTPGDISFAEYRQLAARHGASALTAAPSPGVYQQVCETLLRQAEAVVVVSPPAELSTTYANATLAARAIGDERVRVIDPRTAAAGQGLVALAAARTAGAGADLDAVVDRVLSIAARVEIWATLTNLEQLRRSGRVPAVAAVGAGALGLQPIVRYARGSPRVVGVTRNRERAAAKIFRAWERSAVPSAALELIVLHSDRRDEAEEIARLVRLGTASERIAVVEVSAGLAAHTGPGLLGVAWFWEHLH